MPTPPYIVIILLATWSIIIHAANDPGLDAYHTMHSSDRRVMTMKALGEEATPEETRVMAWGMDNGLFINSKKVRWPVKSKLGRSMIAISDIDDVEAALMYIPKQICMYIAGARADFKDEVLNLLLASHPDFDDFVQMAVYVMDQYMLGVGLSFYGPYLAMLPSTHNTPDLWSDEDLEALQNEQYVAYVKQREVDHAHMFQQIQHVAHQHNSTRMKKYTLERFRWAIRILETRAFGVGEQVRALFPFADFLNHNSDSRCSVFEGEEFVTFVADKTLKGREVFNNYGCRTNRETLDYGFASLRNKHDRMDLQLGPNEDDDVTLRWYTKNEFLPWEVMRQMLKIVQSRQDDDCIPLSTSRFDVNVLDYCASKLNELLEGHPTSIRSDLRYLHAVDDGFMKMTHHRRLAVYYRLGRKRLLRAHAEFCKAAAIVSRCLPRDLELRNELRFFLHLMRVGKEFLVMEYG